MKLLVDENMGPVVSRALRSAGHDVRDIGEEAAGSIDTTVLARAQIADRLVITADRDFGQLVFQQRLPASVGVVYVRLHGWSAAAIGALLVEYFHRDIVWRGRFSVIEPKRFRQVSLTDADADPTTGP